MCHKTKPNQKEEHSWVSLLASYFESKPKEFYKHGISEVVERWNTFQDISISHVVLFFIHKKYTKIGHNILSKLIVPVLLLEIQEKVMENGWREQVS